MGAAFFFSLNANAALKIAVVDTGFCPERIKVHSKTQKILPPVDMTGTVSIDCKAITDKQLEESGRFHGQNVLKEFLTHLSPKIAVSITPLVIYDYKGNQTLEAWKKTIAYIEKEKIDFTLTASGLVNGEKIVETLPGIWFIPSGRVEKLITESTPLFPQNLAPQKNLFMIGDFYDGNQSLYDQGLKYQDQISYYFPSGPKDFNGTSRAVSEAMAVALNKCFSPKERLTAEILQMCLKKNARELNDPINKKVFKTF